VRTDEITICLKGAGKDKDVFGGIVEVAECGENRKAPRFHLGALNLFPAERTESSKVLPRSFEPVFPAERTEKLQGFTSEL